MGFRSMPRAQEATVGLACVDRNRRKPTNGVPKTETIQPSLASRRIPGGRRSAAAGPDRSSPAAFLDEADGRRQARLGSNSRPK